MHWADKIAEEIIAAKPDKNEYVCASGISPSGAVHIGNFREIATSYFVVRALEKRGKKARLLFSWDEFDRLRKVPKNVAAVTDDFDKYIGMPYALIPDPYGKCASYADYNEKQFEASLDEMDIHPDTRYQAKEYLSGRYTDMIILSLKRRREIYDILMKYKTQDSDEGDRNNYYPVNVYCDKCGKDTTEVVSVSDDCEELTFRCKCCGQEKTVRLRDYTSVKLVWKVDWPMRWGAEGVDFEPGGRDHAAENGSYVVACDIAKNIFGIEPPIFYGYEWLSIAGLGDMHSSTGNNITPGAVLKVYEPEMVRWLFAKYAPEAPFSFNFDDTIIRHYGEFDKGLEAYKNGTADEFNQAVYELCLLKGKDTRTKVPFGVLASVAPIVDFKPDLVKKVLNKIDVEFNKEDEERLERVKEWITVHQPSKMFKLLKEKNADYYETLNDEQRSAVKALHDYLANTDGVKEKDVQSFIYSVINDETLSKKENMARQQSFFKVFYNLLFGLDAGPRLYLYLAAADKNDYLKLLD
ncbi:MAG: lysine--tRNA ligase [Clostridia bacterium]|nr:lysine--tRNA ligase [Clostridia bacterium]